MAAHKKAQQKQAIKAAGGVDAIEAARSATLLLVLWCFGTCCLLLDHCCLLSSCSVLRAPCASLVSNRQLVSTLLTHCQLAAEDKEDTKRKKKEEKQKEKERKKLEKSKRSEVHTCNLPLPEL